MTELTAKQACCPWIAFADVLDHVNRPELVRLMRVYDHRFEPLSKVDMVTIWPKRALDERLLRHQAPFLRAVWLLVHERPLALVIEREKP